MTTITTKMKDKLDTRIQSSFGGQEHQQHYKHSQQQQRRHIQSILTNSWSTNSVNECDYPKKMSQFLYGIVVSSCFLLSNPVYAVSGGGLDFANLDITGQNFSNGNYKGKDFTQVIAKGTNFQNSNLQGCRFYKAFLVNTDFSGADLRGASLEDTSMDGASLKGANAAGAYFSASLLEAGSLEDVDFTDAQIPMKTISLLCAREDVRGTNPITGIDTRESLLCPE